MPQISEIADWISATVEGDASVEITGLAKIEQAQPGQLSFIANPKYNHYIHTTEASAIIVGMDFPQSDKILLRAENPYFAFLQAARNFYNQGPSMPQGVHESAVIGEGTKIGENVAIGPFVYIGRNCRIGNGVVLYPGVVIDDEVSIGDDSLIYANVSIREQCRIGKTCILHMGAVIGSDGFGFAFQAGTYHKLPQMGIVVLEDYVEIGANTTIDRATMGETRIHKGTKLDNLIQVAHNVEIGESTVIAAQTGISGSTKIGDFVKCGGQVGIVGHISIGNKATLGAQTGVTKNGSTVYDRTARVCQPWKTTGFVKTRSRTGKAYRRII